MKTITAGFRNVRRAPLAVLPLTIEGVIGAILVAGGMWPASTASAASTAVFPLDIFFDVKQGIAYSSSWSELFLVIVLSVAVRTTVLTASLYLSDHGEQAALPYKYWFSCVRWAALSAVAFVPSAALYYMGVAGRYSPFVAVAGLLGVPVAAFGVRKVMGVLVPGDPPAGRGPTLFEALAYGYILCFVGAAMSVLGAKSSGLAALMLAPVGPLNALVLLGWREHIRSGREPGRGTFAALLTVVVGLGLSGIAVIDRFASSPPQSDPKPQTTLLLLGGQDSTMRASDLEQIHLSQIGFDRHHARVLSYDGPGHDYSKAATHRNLDVTARRVAAQIKEVERSSLLGHSQAALIMDRILAKGLPAPSREVDMAPPPVYPPPLSAPPPGKSGSGKPGADLTRIVDWGLHRAGLPGFEIDAPAAPVHLGRVVVVHPKIPRLAIFSVDDAAWLTGDWRRPGEVNTISLADHSGVVYDGYALDVTKRFFAGKKVAGDQRSWKSVLVDVVSYAFGPWKPGD